MPKRNKRTKAALKRGRIPKSSYFRKPFEGFEKSPVKSPRLSDEKRRGVSRSRNSSPLSSITTEAVLIEDDSQNNLDDDCDLHSDIASSLRTSPPGAVGHDNDDSLTTEKEIYYLSSDIVSPSDVPTFI